MTLCYKPDAGITDGMLCIYVGGHYMQMPPEVSREYVRKLQGLDAKLQRIAKRQKRQNNKLRGNP